MATALVTGAAGFIGSHLVEALLAEGHRVRGIDCFTPYYARALKERNLEALRADDRVEVVEADLRTAELRDLIDGCSLVFHQAGQPGVRLSWSDGFADYDSHNVLATQRMLEAAKEQRVDRFVFASSSSVYGNAPRYPTRETDLPEPHSPYGVTKLAAEHLCSLYAKNWGVPTISLRYFTVYGPRQRPDMAMHRLIASGMTGEPFPLYGDGSAVRDFTFVGDIVTANLAAAAADCPPGMQANIAGGASTSVSELLDLAGELLGAPVAIERHPPQAGDVARTGGDTSTAARRLGWHPTTSLREGLTAQINAQRDPSITPRSNR